MLRHDDIRPDDRVRRGWSFVWMVEAVTARHVTLRREDSGQEIKITLMQFNRHGYRRVK